MAIPEATLAEELRAIRGGVPIEKVHEQVRLSFEQQIREQWRLRGLYEHRDEKVVVRPPIPEDERIDAAALQAEMKQTKRRIQLAMNDVAASMCLGVGMCDADGRFVPLPDEVVRGLQDAVTYGWWETHTL